MGWLDFFKRPPLRPRSAQTTVTFDGEVVTCRRISGVVETVRWDDLQSVCIETTDRGPAVDDVYWVLAGAKTGCVIPSEAEGMNPLLERLQKLPNFDNHAVIRAMQCCENQRHVCWQRATLPDRS